MNEKWSCETKESRREKVWVWSFCVQFSVCFKQSEHIPDNVNRSAHSQHNTPKLTGKQATLQHTNSRNTCLGYRSFDNLRLWARGRSATFRGSACLFGVFRKAYLWRRVASVNTSGFNFLCFVWIYSSFISFQNSWISSKLSAFIDKTRNKIL